MTGPASARSHVSDRLIIEDVIAVTGAQQFKEVEAALGVRLAAFGVKAVWPYKNPRFVPPIGKADTRP